MAKKSELQKLDERREKLEGELEKLYEEFARWEKQIAYDFKDRGDESGLGLLRNLPVDECMGAMRHWLDIAQAKQRVVDLEADYAAWLWRTQAKKLSTSSRFSVTRGRILLG